MTADLDEARPFLIDGAVGASHIMIGTRSSIDEFAHTAWRNDAVGPDKRTLKEACYLLLNCSLFGGLRPDERAEVVALAASAATWIGVVLRFRFATLEHCFKLFFKRSRRNCK